MARGDPTSRVKHPIPRPMSETDLPIIDVSDAERRKFKELKEYRRKQRLEEIQEQCRRVSGFFDGEHCHVKVKEDEPLVEYVASGRYGYYCIDMETAPMFHSGITLETVECGLTEKEAESLAGALNYAASGGANEKAKRHFESHGIIFEKL